MTPNIPRRLQALEAKAGVGASEAKPWRRIIDNGEPDIPQRIAALEAAGFDVICRVIVDPTTTRH